jgi:hypothetical protein
MKFTGFITGPQTGHYITIKPDPRPAQHVDAVAVPEGGSTLLFLLVALTAIGGTATRRYSAATGGNARSERTTGLSTATPTVFHPSRRG